MAYQLSEINQAVRSDPKGFVEESDAAFQRKIENAARKIADHLSESRIVLLSGPAGSGKTTTSWTRGRPSTFPSSTLPGRCVRRSTATP